MKTIAESIIEDYRGFGAQAITHDLHWVTLKFENETIANIAAIKVDALGIKAVLNKDTHVTNENPWEVTFRNK